MPENNFEQPQPERIIYVKAGLFEMIKNGTKTSEVRVGFDSFERINIGDEIVFSSGDGERVNVKITNIKHYQTLDDLLQNEKIENIAPNTSLDSLKQIAHKLFKPADIEDLGLIVFDFEKI